jgi:hypothetical protein
MAEATAIASVHGALSEPQQGLYFAPVRHHSPVCAWAVRALIREVAPKLVLIEAPDDFTPHIDLLAQAETKPPVAIVALVNEGKGHRVAAYYPFCVHAPEYVAVREARAAGAEVRFIDLPAASKATLRTHDETTPISLTEEAMFDSGDFVRSLCQRTGCRDGYELWDHLFESRLGDTDWRALLADIGAYCAGIRAATPAGRIERNGDLAREAHMSAAIIDAIASGGPVVVVTGGFHTPALIEAVARGEASRAKQPDAASRSFLIRYSFAALDALNGYGAGLPQPFYYDFLWRRANDGTGAPVWRETALDLATEFTRKLRAQGHSISVPQQVEMIRVAEALAQMRGRPGASRHDLIDAARTALIKGEASRRDVWTERLLEFLRGDAIGDVPASAGSPPLVEHARSLARAHRIDISDGARRRRQLDIRRKPAHLAASRYFHAMTLLGTNFANREAGPDYLSNTQLELLFEEWSFAWSPTVEGRLIELAAQADRVDTACLAVLRAARDALRASGAGADIAAIVDLVAQGLLAGVGDGLAEIVADLAADIQTHADFTSVAFALRRLYNISSSGGPLRAPAELDLKGVTAAAYLRLVYLCDDLPNTRADAAGARVEALRIMAELLNSDEAGVFDRTLFDEAIDRVADANPPAEILGAVLAICVQAGRRTPDDLNAALSGRFAGSVQEEHERLGALTGMLHAAPQLLWRTPGVLEVIDNFLGGLDEASFLALLPHMRLAFSALNPREIDLVAARLAQLLGGGASSFAGAHHSLSQADFDRGLALDKDLRAAAARDGLDAWLLGEPSSKAEP